MLAHRQHRLALVLSIIDNGPGVPEHIRDRIFHPLRQPVPAARDWA